ncbi:ABC transporter substrate-binding protein [Synechococcus sp. L2F]|uniref:CmpA/NrtA family ABC transporter substrate-binding protein n=1 Tax=Synechococcus sp. L2F TaxID=2823739 RepID=UPI0020CC8B89|nr:ABC transporter substrate-binding protein [Synechococcus sp. L2F]MCP9828084.1 ABC transporter substrate-binding protein [Synechococcus sp. L2F]
MPNLSRRKFLVTAAGTTAGALWLSACGGKQPDSASVPAASGGGGDVEVKGATLGFIALTDAAPVIIAQEKGFFAKHGMPEVKVVKQTSWAATRDNLELGTKGGGIDGAHILTPMPLLLTAGKITKSNQPLPMVTLARLNLQGQGISAAKAFLPEKLTIDNKAGLEAAVAAAGAKGKKFKAAVTFPGGTHDLWMRYWLAAHGIDPNTAADLVVIPPPQMVANMQTGTMDTFCVGEPWNERLVNKKLGYTVAQTGELWKLHPEKAFSMRADWVEQNPKATLALLKGVLEAQMWCDDPANLDEMCTILAKDKYIKATVSDIKPRLAGNVDYGDGRVVKDSPYKMRFWADSASFPYKSHDKWFVTEDMRWGYLPASTDIDALVDKVNRADLWKEAAKAIGQEASIPASDSRGKETFFDGVVFDPEDPKAYLDALKIKALA